MIQAITNADVRPVEPYTVEDSLHKPVELSQRPHFMLGARARVYFSLRHLKSAGMIAKVEHVKLLKWRSNASYTVNKTMSSDTPIATKYYVNLQSTPWGCICLPCCAIVMRGFHTSVDHSRYNSVRNNRIRHPTQIPSLSTLNSNASPLF